MNEKQNYKKEKTPPNTTSLLKNTQQTNKKQETKTNTQFICNRRLLLI